MDPRAAAVAGLLALLFACGRSELTLSGGLQGTAPDAGSAQPSDVEASADVPAGVDDGPPSLLGAAEGPLPEASLVDAPRTVSTCGPGVCPGCCQPDGTCVTSANTNACGAGGEPCVTCAVGEFCKGACVRFQSNCGPSNCYGCCGGDNVCTTGRNDVACGQNGQQCQRCVPSEGTGRCVAQPAGGGLCNAVVSCAPSNCDGCCQGNVCVVGLNQDHCGNAGAPCERCPAKKECVLVGSGGRCADVGSCDPSTCVGCCQGNVCAYGNQDVACGAGGIACSDCTSGGAKCLSGTCQ